MCAGAGFHADQARRLALKEFQHLAAPKLAAQNGAALGVNTVQLENRFRQVDPDRDNLVHGWLPSLVRVTTPNMAHCDAGSGSHPLHQWRNNGLSSVSFSDRLPCRAWFSSAIRCSCRRVISVSAATVSINARTAARCAAGMVERSMDGVADMPDFYQKSPVKTRKINQMIHSAAAGGRVSSALTLRHLRRENSPPDCFLIRLVLWISMAPGVEGSHCPPRHLWRAVAAVGSCPPWS